MICLEVVYTLSTSSSLIPKHNHSLHMHQNVLHINDLILVAETKRELQHMLDIDWTEPVPDGACR